jgi:hypothetical protein
MSEFDEGLLKELDGLVMQSGEVARRLAQSVAPYSEVSAEPTDAAPRGDPWRSRPPKPPDWEKKALGPVDDRFAGRTKVKMLQDVSWNIGNEGCSTKVYDEEKVTDDKFERVSDHSVVIVEAQPAGTFGGSVGLGASGGGYGGSVSAGVTAPNYIYRVIEYEIGTEKYYEFRVTIRHTEKMCWGPGATATKTDTTVVTGGDWVLVSDAAAATLSTREIRSGIVNKAAAVAYANAQACPPRVIRDDPSAGLHDTIAG